MSRGNSGKDKKKLTENRLEKAQASVAEQLAMEEQKRKKELKKKRRASVTLVSAVRKESRPTTLTMIFSVLLSTMLGTGFSFMLMTTYGLKADLFVFVLFLGLISWGMSYCHASDSKSAPFVLAAFLGMVALFICSLDILKVQTEVNYAYSILQKSAFHELEPVYTDPKELEAIARPITLLMLLINLIPAFFTTLVVERRKNILLSLVWYIPFFFCTTVITFMTPKEWPCVLAVGGVVILLIFQFVRRLGDDTVDERMLKISAPVIILCALFSALFPVSRYDKDKLAERHFTKIQEIFDEIGSRLPFGELTGRSKKDDEPEVGFQGAIIAHEDDEESTEANVTSEDFSKVGFFNPPDIKLMKLLRYYNDTENHQVRNTGRMIYLKCTSMEMLEKEGWRTAYYGESKPEDAYILNMSEIEGSEADYVLTVQPYVQIPVYLVPEYADHFFLSPESRYASAHISVRTTWNLTECVLNPGETVYNYAFNMVPQKRAPEWNPEYLDEVYGTCLEVPEETKQSILDSGVLPTWYKDLLEGKSEMTTAEKVGTVIEYVRNLHPYDAQTPYPPEGADFVTWFMTQSQSGFCVHYATTTATLLRMIGVPVRYVSGYLVGFDLNSTRCEVSMKDAHAWIEFFDPDYGWVMDDPTPGNGIAASYYNAYSIAKEYGDMNYDYRLSPTPKPKPKPVKKPAATVTPTPVPLESEEAPKNVIPPIVKRIATHPVTVTVVSVVLFVLLLRLGYVLFWKIRIRRASMNKKASIYTSYFSMHNSILEAPPSRVAESIRKKAEFGSGEISEKELSDLVRFGDHNLDIQRAGCPWIRRFLSRILRVKL